MMSRLILTPQLPLEVEASSRQKYRSGKKTPEPQIIASRSSTPLSNSSLASEISETREPELNLNVDDDEEAMRLCKI